MSEAIRTAPPLGGEAYGSEAEWARGVQVLLDDRQPFRAHDLGRQGIARFPESIRLRQLCALALLATGAIEEARRTLEQLPIWAAFDEAPFRRLHAALSDAIAATAGRAAEETPSREALQAIGGLSRALDDVRGKQLLSLSGDPEAVELLARIYHESWRHGGGQGDLERSFELFREAFRMNADPRTGVRAAAAAQILGHGGQAAVLARRAVETAEAAPAQGFWHHAALGEAHLLLQQPEPAKRAFQQARDAAAERYQDIVSLRQQLLQLAEAGTAVPADILSQLQPPSIVVFTGPMLDRPGAGKPLFPPHLEHALRAEIDRRLELMQAQIGYSSAACGADLLFVEAMLERGAEVNIILPFALEDFIAANVAFAGQRWVRRFHNALKLASSVSFATDERFLGHELLFRFGNQVLHGMARLRAGFLTTEPQLLAVWDLMSGSLPGGAADFIDHWGDPRRLQIVDIDDLLSEHPAPADPLDCLGPASATAPPLQEAQGRVIKGMLFADLVGYSALKEEHVPAFLAFMQALQAELAACPAKPDFVYTWGDALFAVTPRASAIAEYALAVQQAVKRLGGTSGGLPRPLNIRISLHAGPVFAAADPFTGKPNCYGSHINRAARLEPVTVPGHVYATQPFVALLAAEQSEERYEAERSGQRYRERFVSEYVGILPLAKKYGNEAVYHLRALQPQA